MISEGQSESEGTFSQGWIHGKGGASLHVLTFFFFSISASLVENHVKCAKICSVSTFFIQSQMFEVQVSYL